MARHPKSKKPTQAKLAPKKFYYAGRRLTYRDPDGNRIEPGSPGSRKHGIHDKAARRLIRGNAFVGRRLGRMHAVKDGVVFTDERGHERLPPVAMQLDDTWHAKADVRKQLAENSHEAKRLWELAKLERKEERQKARAKAMDRGWGTPHK